MDKSQFSKNAPGTLVQIPDDLLAFVPGNLPPKNLTLNELLSRSLTYAHRSLGELNGIGTVLPNPHLLMGPLKTREAILSSRIEGTFASAEELTLFEANPQSTPSHASAMEVSNYIKALEFALEKLIELPVGSRLIREAHARLMQDVRGGDKAPGEFRRIQNHIGLIGRPAKEARFIPPPPNYIPDLIQDLENFVHSSDKYDPLIRLAIVHYQFEAIHPFNDGNGRIGRLMIALILSEWKILDRPLLYMSSYFERTSEQYRNYLLEVSTEGKWEQWIVYFLEGISEQAKDAVTRCNLLLELQKKYRTILQNKRVSARNLELLDALFEKPWVTVPLAASRLQVSHNSAQKLVEKLVASGILFEATGQRRNRIYLAREILEIVKRN